MVRNGMSTIGMTRCTSRRGGFTLVELLVVIVIIGILASLITMAVFAALRRAKEAAIYQEVSKVYGAFESFREKFTVLPPDGNGGNQKMQRFVQKAFPRARAGEMPEGDVMNTESGPARAIVYWLSEVSTDPKRPFKKESGGLGGSNTQSEDFFKFFEFPAGRVRNGKFYAPDYEPDVDPPYLYFYYETYADATYRFREATFKPYDRGQSQSKQGGGGGGNNREYAAPETCQIISAGLDKLLGTGGTLMLDSAAAAGGAEYISKADEDNIVAFSTMKIGDIRE